ncbi:hypothetical protein GpartN1_g4050.t1 [Galdieria partita]|uniref:Uncharacterized protein n=1 Tax=Galdieria partita TaxID=83374 RepID=A0A9C7PY10_9RHOD|nr:hypothetical protein GpartN1_g4050.t1 [Galdieria partita]
MKDSCQAFSFCNHTSSVGHPSKLKLLHYLRNTNVRFSLRNYQCVPQRRGRPFAKELVKVVTTGLNRDYTEQYNQLFDHILSRNRICLVGRVTSKPLLSTLKTGQKMTVLNLKVNGANLPEDKFPKHPSKRSKLPDNFILQFFDRVAYVVVQRVEEGCKLKVFGRLGVGRQLDKSDAKGNLVLVCSSFSLIEPSKEHKEEEGFQKRQEPLVILRKPEELCETSLLFSEENPLFSSLWQHSRDKSLDIVEQDSNEKQASFEASLNHKDWSILDNIF